MRLIDVDKITITRQEYVGALTLKERLQRLLKFQPTVKAIPIEWLRNFQHFLDEEVEKISKEKDKNPLDIIGETWQFMSMSQAIDIIINKYGAENNLDKKIYGSEYIKGEKENGLS